MVDHILTLEGVGIRFGGLKAVSGLDLAIPRGGLIGLIGPNGAGKTTVFNLITGLYRPTEGNIRLNGVSVVGWAPARIAAAGVGRTFQNIRLFGGLTVRENVMVGLTRHLRAGVFASALRLGAYWEDEAVVQAEAARLLDAFGLTKVGDLGAEQLSYGMRRRLEIARALASRPKLLLLDEPAAGMNPSEVHELTALIRWVRDTFQVSILLIEHHMPVVMGLCERVTVIDHGARIAEGTPEEIRENPKVIEAYLGADV